ncbi:MAG: GTP-binding protein, partial [Desulfurococcales archaeon ex4484_42]
NPVEIAVRLINKIVKHNPKAFLQAYSIDSTDPNEILRVIAIKRGWLYKKDREPILQEAAKALIRDYLDGKIPFYVKPPQP